MNGENAVTGRNLDEFKRHRGSAVDGVFIVTSRVEATLIAKRSISIEMIEELIEKLSDIEVRGDMP